MHTEVTFNWCPYLKCNFRCPYCFFYSEWAELEKTNKIFPLNKWLKAWNRIYDKYGTTRIEISGGEPFIYPDFVNLVKGISKQHNIQITTNLSISIHALHKFIDSADSGKVSIMASYHPCFIDFEVFLEKVNILKRNNFCVDVLYVAYSPQLSQMSYFKKRLKEYSIDLIPVPFRGEYNQIKYPQGYTEREKEIIYNYSERMDSIKRRWIHNQLNPKKTKGKLCEAGAIYAYIEPGGKVRRCPGIGEKPFAIFFDDHFELLPGPLFCSAEICPCDFKWLIEEELL